MKRAAGHLAIRLWAVLSLAGIATAAEQGRGTIQFDRDIRPILSESCFACHGPDGAKRKADLRLDTREGLFGLPKGGGRVVTPGQPNKSALLQRITSADKDELMPPPKTGKQLSAAQIALLHRWVEAGAPWSPGWAFTPPQLPKVPTVKQATWPRSDLDRFILAALEQRGWRPAPEADRVTLIRRLSYDLIGLPPTPEEVDAFLADTSPQAYERVVDRLLASKHFGERMAQHWLDLARYADSDGYHDDYLREMHGYRDYVIAAFNRNLPFDQFTIEQLAGDLLPDATREQIVATAFNRNGPTTSENGADAEEYRLRYASERVNTTASVWLGLSLACAECHDHKYDPLTTRDYYRMFAFFDQVPGNPLANGAQAKPILRVVSPDMHDRLIAAEEELQRRQAALRKLYYEPRSDWDRAQAAWEQRMRDTKLEPMRFGDWWLSGPYVGPSGERFPPERAHVDGDRAAAKLFKWVAPPDAGTNEVKFAAREGITYLQRDVATTVGGIVRCRINTNVTAQVWLNERLVHASGRDAESPGTVKLFNVRVPPGRHRLLVKLTPVDMKAKGDITFGARESTAHRMRTETFKENKTFDIPWAKRSTNDATMVRRVFRELHVAEIDAAQNEVELAQERQTAAARGSSQMRIMAEGTNRVPTHILMRGDYRRKGELVHAAVPATLGSLPSDAKADRLALARWLTARDNPLTARVTVNRFWQMIFGTGIVKTSEDFGAQGEPPTHPELLDWLAVRFMDGGWDVKNMLRLIVTSATYRQSSQIPNSTDPENRWLARGPRFRLPAEFIRDTALAASGLLDRDRAPEGRSVLPYQPGPDLWREFAFAESLKYIQDHGEELYRRGVYIFWKRSVLHPYLAVMDAPTRDVCTARRPVTNTPTQALALLNETLLVECARVLAQRLLLAESLDNKARLTRAFRLVLARQPTERESAVLLGLHADSLRHYQADLAAAKKLVAVGESERPAKLDPAQHAAWLCVCNALLNLDEALTKE